MPLATFEETLELFLLTQNFFWTSPRLAKGPCKVLTLNEQSCKHSSLCSFPPFQCLQRQTSFSADAKPARQSSARSSFASQRAVDYNRRPTLCTVWGKLLDHTWRGVLKLKIPAQWRLPFESLKKNVAFVRSLSSQTPISTSFISIVSFSTTS